MRLEALSGRDAQSWASNRIFRFRKARTGLAWMTFGRALAHRVDAVREAVDPVLGRTREERMDEELASEHTRETYHRAHGATTNDLFT